MKFFLMSTYTGVANFEKLCALLTHRVYLLTQKPITHEAERIFKIVLAGDAAVGKSSFILRLCKNKFIPNLNSTLGLSTLLLFLTTLLCFLNFAFYFWFVC